MLIWTKCHVINQEGLMSHYVLPKKGSRVDQPIPEEILKLPPPISIHFTQSFPDFHVKSWYNMLAQCTSLIRANRRRALYEHFSAMLTMPPDWPCPFVALRDITTLDILWTPS